MKSRRKNVTEDLQAILGRHARSTNAYEYSEPIPIDLIIEILSRLPVKSIARCRCVSKLWASILRRPDLTDFYLTKSSARPKLLLAYRKDSELFFFSAPQPQNPNESSSPLAATYHMKIPFTGSYDIVSVINGIVLIRNKQTFKSVLVICNPSTGQSLTLPKPKTRTKIYIQSYFGYDPIKKQLKVLAMTERDGISKEHQVLTLGTKKLSWRMIECCIPHVPVGFKGICINGVLYYRASVNGSSRASMIVCFDVESEKFSFIEVMEPFIRVLQHAAVLLINYKGNLGSLISQGNNYISESRIFEMWLLKDPIKHEWSKHIYKLLPPRQDGRAERSLLLTGVTGTNEIMLTPFYPSDPCHVFCCNIERKTYRRVEIQGMGASFKDNKHMFLDHVENVKLMEDFIT